MLSGIDRKEGRLFVALLFSLGLIQIAGFWFAGAMVNGPGPLAIPQPDAPLYLQSARRVAEGFPFSFSPGSAICTGSTTVLHPFLFSLPFLLGLDADSAIACSFGLNAFFYLVFLFSWGYVISKWQENHLARYLAIVLLALFGQAAYAALAMSDIGLWLAVSGLLVAGLASKSIWLTGVFLILGPWIRPEGMVAAIAFSLVVFFMRSFRKEKVGRADGWLAVAGIISMLGVFGLNYALTGHLQFSSVASKGHFATRPFFAAVYCAVNDLCRMGSSFFFGVINEPLRQLYMLPVIGAVAFWIGVITHKWEDWRQFVFPLAAAGGLWTVAASGWQGTNADRYVAWIMPFIVIMSASGLAWLYTRVSHWRSSVVILALPIVFSIGSMVAFWSLFNNASRKSDLTMKFGRELSEMLPEEASVGLAGNCGLAYPLKGHGVRTLYGIYSPEFEGPHLTCALETLKNRPETRFDYWVFADDDDFVPALVKLQGQPVLIGPGGLCAYRADWSAFDNSAAVPSAFAGNMLLKQRVDVGFLPEERLAGYEVETRYGLPPLNAFQHVAKLNGASAYESGRAIWGCDSMFVALDPGKDVLVVMRTIREKDVEMPNALGADIPKHFDFGASPGMNVAVDGRICATVRYEVGGSDFVDVTIRIPGSAIVNPVSRIAFLGDHITCGYWFFQ